ncbi:alpha-1,2-fucosyltransferase [uncultured Draconibacterium sp.]|uniref:alpha-1,2-fucosyltransferase n=1 Tax=uncultured Draconibacterium sp. TaxID=1573823 RepID=UPI003216D291
MNIVKVIGGLGNQMFQVAFALAMQEKGIFTKIDITAFKNYSLHYGYEIPKIFKCNTTLLEASLDEINEFKDTRKFFKWRKLLGRLLLLNPNSFISHMHYIEKRSTTYDETILFSDEKYLEGYWQNEQFFSHIGKQIVDTFEWSSIDEKNRKLSERMKKENSVSLHVRKLDQPKNFKEFLYRIRLTFLWRTASKDYYQNAIKLIEERVPNPVFYLFSDNLKWTKDNLEIKGKYEIIDYNRGTRSHYDMFLMTQCKHNIISMSSFSWWGAWLNQNADKIIIAPKKWANRFNLYNNIIPPNWLKI